MRTASALLVVVIGLLYLLPQFQGAGLAMETATGRRPWAGALVVAVVVLLNVLAGGMRTITFVQAFQYWLKLTALLVPLVFLLGSGSATAAGPPADPRPVSAGVDGPAWADPIDFAGDHPLYSTYSLIVATFLGTMGLPHVVVRFYTNPDGRAARQTTLVVLALLGLFYVLPPVYGALGRLYAPDLAGARAATRVVLELPARMVGGLGGDLLAALLTAGAFAAFLSTSSGLTVAVAGRAHPGRRLAPVRGRHRLPVSAAVVAVVVPSLLALVTRDVGVATVVGLAFAMAAATFCPLLVLGIWWRGLTDVGRAGRAGGRRAAHRRRRRGHPARRPHRRLGRPSLLGQPAAWSVPLAFATMVGVSRPPASPVPAHISRFLVRLHTPEAVRARPRLSRARAGAVRTPGRPTVRRTASTVHRRGGPPAAHPRRASPRRRRRCERDDDHSPSTCADGAHHEPHASHPLTGGPPPPTPTAPGPTGSPHDQAVPARPGLRPAARDGRVHRAAPPLPRLRLPRHRGLPGLVPALRRHVELGDRTSWAPSSSATSTSPWSSGCCSS